MKRKSKFLLQVRICNKHGVAVFNTRKEPKKVTWGLLLCRLSHASQQAADHNPNSWWELSRTKLLRIQTKLSWILQCKSEPDSRDWSMFVCLPLRACQLKWKYSVLLGRVASFHHQPKGSITLLSLLRLKGCCCLSSCGPSLVKQVPQKKRWGGLTTCRNPLPPNKSRNSEVLHVS